MKPLVVKTEPLELLATGDTIIDEHSGEYYVATSTNGFKFSSNDRLLYLGHSTLNGFLGTSQLSLYHDFLDQNHKMRYLIGTHQIQKNVVNNKFELKKFITQSLTRIKGLKRIS